MGPAIGGMILVFCKPVFPYLLASCSSLICLTLLIPIRPAEQIKLTGNRTFEALMEGVRFVFGTRLLLAAISMDLFAVLLGGATALLPIYARDILDVGPWGLGWLRAAPAVGAVVMGFVIAHSGAMKKPGKIFLLAITGFGIATIIFGISTSFYLSLFFLMLIGAMDAVSVVFRGTIMQLLTPDSMRGRVSAVNSVFISSSNELGGFESGALARLIGAEGAVVFGGIGTVAVVLVSMIIWPEILKLGPLKDLKPDEIEKNMDSQDKQT